MYRNKASQSQDLASREEVETQFYFTQLSVFNIIGLSLMREVENLWAKWRVLQNYTFNSIQLGWSKSQAIGWSCVNQGPIFCGRSQKNLCQNKWDSNQRMEQGPKTNRVYWTSFNKLNMGLMAKAKVQQTCENQWSTLYTSNNKFRDKRLKKQGKLYSGCEWLLTTLVRGDWRFFVGIEQ